MNDRFKFRVWDNLCKRYDDLHAIYLAQSGSVCYPIVDIGITYPSEDSEYIVEQCTGLRDRNGRLIYEGDIVRYNFPGAPHEIVAWNEKTCRWVTRRGEDTAMVFATSIAINSKLPDEGLIIEGNVHDE